MKKQTKKKNFELIKNFLVFGTIIKTNLKIIHNHLSVKIIFNSKKNLGRQTKIIWFMEENT